MGEACSSGPSSSCTRFVDSGSMFMYYDSIGSTARQPQSRINLCSYLGMYHVYNPTKMDQSSKTSSLSVHSALTCRSSKIHSNDSNIHVINRHRIVAALYRDHNSSHFEDDVT